MDSRVICGPQGELAGTEGERERDEHVGGWSRGAGSSVPVGQRSRHGRRTLRRSMETPPGLFFKK